jgi:hypothetical protein
VRASIAILLFASLIQGQDSKLNIVVVEGQDAINNIRQPVTREPVVEVQDEKHEPVQGASITFFLPTQGPGGTFANGTNTMTVTTDRNGRAVTRGIRCSKQPGRFEIRVSASYQGQTASAIITQTNVAGISTSGSGPSKVWIIVGLGAAAVVGGVLAAKLGGSSSSSSSSSGPIVITPGTPTVGGPH